MSENTPIPSRRELREATQRPAGEPAADDAVIGGPAVTDPAAARPTFDLPDIDFSLPGGGLRPSDQDATGGNDARADVQPVDTDQLRGGSPFIAPSWEPTELTSNIKAASLPPLPPIPARPVEAPMAPAEPAAIAKPATDALAGGIGGVPAAQRPNPGKPDAATPYGGSPLFAETSSYFAALATPGAAAAAPAPAASPASSMTPAATPAAPVLPASAPVPPAVPVAYPAGSGAAGAIPSSTPAPASLEEARAQWEAELAQAQAARAGGTSSRRGRDDFTQSIPPVDPLGDPAAMSATPIFSSVPQLAMPASQSPAPADDFESVLHPAPKKLSRRALRAEAKAAEQAAAEQAAQPALQPIIKAPQGIGAVRTLDATGALTGVQPRVDELAAGEAAPALAPAAVPTSIHPPIRQSAFARADEPAGGIQPPENPTGSFRPVFKPVDATQEDGQTAAPSQVIAAQPLPTAHSAGQVAEPAGIPMPAFEPAGAPVPFDAIVPGMAPSGSGLPADPATSPAADAQPPLFPTPSSPQSLRTSIVAPAETIAAGGAQAADVVTADDAPVAIAVAVDAAHTETAEPPFRTPAPQGATGALGLPAVPATPATPAESTQTKLTPASTRAGDTTATSTPATEEKNSGSKNALIWVIFIAIAIAAGVAAWWLVEKLLGGSTSSSIGALPLVHAHMSAILPRFGA